MIDLDEHGPQPGDELAERYRIDGILGEGSFSTVYRATQTAVGRPVAVKWMKTDVEAAGARGARAFENLVARFRREARIVARLDHPSTVTLHDFGRTDGHDLYMVLEYIDGRDLTELRGRRFAPNRVVALLEQALESLAEAHDHGIIHRDIKPGNLMLDAHRDGRDRLKILDFGIAKVLRSFDEETIRQITGESSLVGTPRYLAPENATNRDPGPPADIYSLGLVAYELLLDERAVPGEHTLDILDSHLDEDFQARIEPRPSIPEGLRHVVNRMVAKSLQARYPTAGAVLEELRALPDYGEAYGRTEEVPQPPAARSDCTTAPETPPPPTDSLPDAPAYGGAAETDTLVAPDDSTAGSTVRDRPGSGSHSRRDGDRPDDRTARERPRPPCARGDDVPSGRDDGGDDANGTGPTRRASFPPGRTCEMPPAESDLDDAVEVSDADSEATTDLRLSLVAAAVVLAVVLAAVGALLVE